MKLGIFLRDVDAPSEPRRSTLVDRMPLVVVYAVFIALVACFAAMVAPFAIMFLAWEKFARMR